MLLALPMFALQWVSPLLLGWLAAAAAPVLIHLWSRRRYQQVAWAAIEYLLAAVRASRRRLLLEQWLLMAVRTLLIVLIVVAAAEPVGSGPPLAAARGEQAYRVLVVDGSYSMGYREADDTRFDRAKRIAGDIVAAAAEGDAASVVLAARSAYPAVRGPAFDKASVAGALQTLAIHHSGLNLSAALELVEGLLATARREHSRLARHEVYFLTDLGRHGWAGEELEPVARHAIQSRLRRLGEMASLVVIDVGEPARGNLAITDLRLVDSLAIPGRPLRFAAVISNFGSQTASQQELQWRIDGRMAAQVKLDIPAGGQATAHFSYQFDSAGEHFIEACGLADELDIDNHRWLVLSLRDRLDVLCVDGAPAPRAGATAFLRPALDPWGNDPARSLARVETADESVLGGTDLARYDAIFLANVARFTRDEAESLRGYLRGGGGVVFFVGDQVDAANYNDRLGATAGSSVPLLPVRIGEVIRRTHQRLDPLGYRHPIVWAFRGREKAGLLTAPVAAHMALEAAGHPATRVALALDDGSPLIVEGPSQRGRVVVVGTSADTSWTDMPRWPSYLPLVQEILAFAVASRFAERNLMVGQPLTGTLPRQVSQDAIAVRPPAGAGPTVPDNGGPKDFAETDATEGGAGQGGAGQGGAGQGGAGQGGAGQGGAGQGGAGQTDAPEGDSWSYAATEWSGVYAASSRHDENYHRLFALNVDTAEGNLARLSANELRRQWPSCQVEYRTSWQDGSPAAAGAGHSSPWAQALLTCALLMLVADTVLAWRFGHGGS